MINGILILKYQIMNNIWNMGVVLRYLKYMIFKIHDIQAHKIVKEIFTSIIYYSVNLL